MIIEKFGHKVQVEFGSSTGPPGYKGMQTSDIISWIKFGSSEWFKSHGRFSSSQIAELVHICKTEYQLIIIMNMLAQDED